MGRIPHTTQRTKRPRNKLNHLHGLQHHGNINVHKRTENYQVQIQRIRNHHSTKTTITRYGVDIPKEALNNIPTFDSKPGELNQFLSTIESYSTMYRICKTDLVMMQARGKVHKIIHHMLQEDTDVEWSVFKRKLTSNYGSTRSGIEASVKISKLSMNSEETVGKYLARAKTLVKSKLKDATAWHHDIDEADTYHVCNGIIQTGLKSRMLRRLSQFKSYKDLFNNIEEE